MSSKVLPEIIVRFPKTEKSINKSFEGCWRRKKFVKVGKETYRDHLEMAKLDLLGIGTDYENENWRWAITKSYYAIFHATNALLVNKLGFFSKDHICAVITLKKENLIPQNIYEKLGKVYERFSDVFGFIIMFEARKISQYDVLKWKLLDKEDARIAWNFAKEFVGFVEGECEK